MAYDLYPAVDEQYAFPPEIRQALATSMELRNDVEPMTTAIRNNLLPAELWDGRTIANTTTDRLERYDSAGLQWHPLINATGDIMTGALTLPGNPVNPLEASPKQYVDSKTSKSICADGAYLAAPANTAWTLVPLTTVQYNSDPSRFAKEGDGIRIYKTGLYRVDVTVAAQFPGASHVIGGYMALLLSVPAIVKPSLYMQHLTPTRFMAGCDVNGGSSGLQNSFWATAGNSTPSSVGGSLMITSLD
jgi:hypothetical protein